MSVWTADGQDSPSGLSALIGLLGMMLELVSTKNLHCRTHNNMYCVSGSAEAMELVDLSRAVDKY